MDSKSLVALIDKTLGLMLALLVAIPVVVYILSKAGCDKRTKEGHLTSNEVLFNKDTPTEIKIKK